MTRDLFFAELRRALENHERKDELLRFAEQRIQIEKQDQADWVLIPPSAGGDWGWRAIINGTELPDMDACAVRGDLSNVNVTLVCKPKAVRIEQRGKKG